jgi:hypothetical protein
MPLPATVDASLNFSVLKGSQHGPFEAYIPGQTQTSAGGVSSVGNITANTKAAWSFVAASNVQLTGIRLSAGENGTIADTFYVTIHDDASGSPGTLLGTSNALGTGAFTAVGLLDQFTFSTPISLTSGSTYWYVVQRTGAIDASNYLSVSHSSSSVVAGIGRKVWNGSTWSSLIETADGAYTLLQTGIFILAVDTTNRHIEMWRSVDGGNTWAESDSVDHKLINNTSGFAPLHFWSQRQTADIVRVWWFNYSGNGFVNTATFTLSTESWGTSASSSGVMHNSDGVHVTGPDSLFLAAYRSNATHVHLIQGATESIMGTAYRRVSYAVGTAAFATVSGTGAQTHFDIRSIAVDAADRTYFFYGELGGTPASNGIRCKVLTSAGVLGSAVMALAQGNVYSAGNYPHTNAVVIDDTTDKVAIGIINTSGDLQLAYSNVADAPSFSATTITTTNDPEYTNANAGALALDGLTIHAFWPPDVTQDIYRDQGTTAGGFTGNVEFKDAVTVNGISIGKITDAIGVLYLDGSTLTYDKHSLAAPATPIAGSDSLSTDMAEVVTSLNVDLPLADSLATDLSESAALLVRIAVAESLTTDLAEEGSIAGAVVPKAGSDSLTPALDEVAALAARGAPSEPITTDLSEAAALAVDLPTVESIAPQLDETTAILVDLAASETLAPDTSETANLIGRLSLADSLAPTTTEVGSIRQATSDTLDLSGWAETAALETASSSAESIAPTLSETGAVAAEIAYAESIEPTLAESATVTSPLALADSVSPLLEESAALLARPAAADSIAPDTGEVAAVEEVPSDGVIEGGDALVVTLSEAAALRVSLPLAESLSTDLAEATAEEALLTAADTLAPTLSDTAVLAVDLPTADTLAPSLSESAALAADLPAAESIAPLTSEAAALTGRIAASDSVAPATSETASGVVRAPAAETIAPTLTESAAANADLAAAESIAPLLTEATLLLLRKAASESIAPTLSESAAVDELDTTVYLNGSDTLAPTLSETASVLVRISQAEELAVTFTENATAFVAVAASDAVSPDTTEGAALLAAIPASDTASPNLVEEATSGAGLLLSEFLIVEVSEAYTASGTLTATETLGLDLAEVAIRFTVQPVSEYYPAGQEEDGLLHAGELFALLPGGSSQAESLLPAGEAESLLPSGGTPRSLLRAGQE